MIGLYFVISGVMSLPIVCDYFTDIFMGSAYDAIQHHFEDSHCSFVVWALWKFCVGITFVVTLGLTVVLTFLVAMMFGWIILPIHILRNPDKYNPVAIWRKQKDEYRKGKS